MTWTSKATGGQPTLVTVEFLEAAGGTELVLTHEGIPSRDVVNLYRTGWSQILDRMAARLLRRA
jgi:hypothetical protein